MSRDWNAYRLYRCWSNMKQRCHHGKRHDAKYYAEKGITYCPEWEDFGNFEKWALANGYDEDLTLDRIDGSKGYTPENCRWITHAEQQRNKSNNLMFTHNGRTQTLTEWAKEFGINRTTLHDRIFKFGYSFDEAVQKSRYQPRNSILTDFDGELLSRGEIARKLGVSKNTISRWARLGYSEDEMKKRATALHEGQQTNSKA